MWTLIFDTETTGLIDCHSMPLDKQPEVIELAATLIDLDTGETSRQIDHLFKPRHPASEEITRITGITNTMLAGALPFEAEAAMLKATIETADAVLAHNLSFDTEMLDFEYERLDKRLEWPALRICTVEQTVHLMGYRLSLTALHDLLFKEPFPEAHRARTDVTALLRCATELRRRGDI